LGAQEANPKLNLAVIADNRNKSLLYDNNVQLNRFYGFGGTTRHWHGVIPLRDVDLSDRFLALLEHFYELDGRRFLENPTTLFIPKEPVRSAYHVKIACRNTTTKVIADTVEEIRKEDNGYQLTTTSGEVYHCKTVVVAVGAADAPALLAKCGHESVLTNVVGDHVCGFAGFLSKEQVSARFGFKSKKVRAERVKQGYFIPAFSTKTNRSLLTIRPARFGMRRVEKQLRGGPVYANTKWRIIQKIIAQAGIGRFLEVAAMRSGLFWDAKLYSIHFQTEFPDFWGLDSQGLLIRPVETTDEELIKEVDTDQFGVTGLRVPPQKLYYGTHMFNTVAEQGAERLKRDNLVVVGPAVEKNIGVGHHSFRSMVLAFNTVKEHVEEHFTTRS